LKKSGGNGRICPSFRQKIPEEKMGVKWIHKGGYSRPDKRTVRKGGKKR